MQGMFDGGLTVGELKGYGDFGLGTFNTLDGEMVELDGTVYKVDYTGVASAMDDETLSPFAYVTYFDVDSALEVDEPIGLADLQALIEENLPSRNLIYAIRIDGEFSYMKTRSPRPQEQPYPTLVEALEDQSVFELQDIGGTVVGFWNPTFLEGLNVSGYHLHFIDDARETGGHILDLMLNAGTVYIDYSYGIDVEMPTNGGYLEMDLGGGTDDIDKVEK